jgi:hypothetical protein
MNQRISLVVELFNKTSVFKLNCFTIVQIVQLLKYKENHVLRALVDFLLYRNINKIAWVVWQQNFPFVIRDLLGIVLKIVQNVLDVLDLNLVNIFKKLLVVVKILNTLFSSLNQPVQTLNQFLVLLRHNQLLDKLLFFLPNCLLDLIENNLGKVLTFMVQVFLKKEIFEVLFLHGNVLLVNVVNGLLDVSVFP